MNLEAQAITAVCTNKDIGTLLSENIDDMFVSHGDIWAAIKSYYNKYSGVPDVELVVEKFPDFEPAPTTKPTAYIVDELRNDFLAAQVREMILRNSQLLQGHAPSAVIDSFQKDISRLEKFTNNVKDIDITDYKQAEDYYKTVKAKADEMGGTVGIPTGVKAIDYSYRTGMAPGHLIVVIGWSGRGKSWWTAYLAVQAWRAGFRPMIVSMEMSPETMRDRIYTVMGEGRFKNSDLVRGNIDISKFDEFGKQEMDSRPGFIVVSSEGHSSVTPNMIQAKIEQHKPDIVIVDYHQLIDDNEKSNDVVKRNMNVSRQLKRLATSNGIPVVDITAATAEEQSDRKDPPMLHHVAWSKAIEYDADMAMAVHKEPDSESMEIVCRKNRHGSMFALWLNWDIDSGVITETFDNDS